MIREMSKNSGIVRKMTAKDLFGGRFSHELLVLSMSALRIKKVLRVPLSNIYFTSL